MTENRCYILYFLIYPDLKHPSMGYVLRFILGNIILERNLIKSKLVSTLFLYKLCKLWGYYTAFVCKCVYVSVWERGREGGKEGERTRKR